MRSVSSANLERNEPPAGGRHGVLSRRLYPAVLRVRLENGETREARVSHNRGGPENPLSDEELETTFRTNAGQVLPVGQVEELEEVLRSLAEAEMVDDVIKLTRIGEKKRWQPA